jgi:hypothetical protein
MCKLSDDKFVEKIISMQLYKNNINKEWRVFQALIKDAIN